MKEFGKHLRDRARALGMTDADVARQAGLSEPRYGHYVRGAREPNLELLCKISRVLGVSPNDLLGFEKNQSDDEARNQQIWRINTALNSLSLKDLELSVLLIEAVLKSRLPDKGISEK
ncbi:MAG: helix-turn-helix transcriptional regulator [Alphaproteobacteria bacterium]|nr:helix-turn-helix transcriptional regulator [Alphaproteobacteria bacterium]